MGHLAQPGRHSWTSCPVLISQPPGAKHGYKAQLTTSVSTGAPSHLVAAPAGSSLLLVDSGSQLSNLAGFALAFESGDLLPSLFWLQTC